MDNPNEVPFEKVSKNPGSPSVTDGSPAIGVGFGVGEGCPVGVSVGSTVGVDVGLNTSSVAAGGTVGCTCVCTASRVAATLVDTILRSGVGFAKGKLHEVSRTVNKMSIAIVFRIVSSSNFV